MTLINIKSDAVIDGFLKNALYRSEWITSTVDDEPGIPEGTQILSKDTISSEQCHYSQQIQLLLSRIICNNPSQVIPKKLELITAMSGNYKEIQSINPLETANGFSHIMLMFYNNKDFWSHYDGGRIIMRDASNGVVCSLRMISSRGIIVPVSDIKTISMEKIVADNISPYVLMARVNL